MAGRAAVKHCSVSRGHGEDEHGGFVIFCAGGRGWRGLLEHAVDVLDGQLISLAASDEVALIVDAVRMVA